jgi:hypothetical protein
MGGDDRWARYLAYIKRPAMYRWSWYLRGATAVCFVAAILNLPSARAFGIGLIVLGFALFAVSAIFQVGARR